MNEETKIIDEIKTKTEDLFKTIKKAEKINLEVRIDFPNGSALIKPSIKVFKVLF